MRWWAWGLGGLVAGVLGTSVVAWIDGELRDTEVIGRVRQPDSVTYPDKSVHYAGVVRIRTWLLHRDRPYEVVVGRAPDLSYGHSVTFEALGPGRPRITAADWRPEGVRIRFGSGHELFVPAERFQGGR